MDLKTHLKIAAMLGIIFCACVQSNPIELLRQRSQQTGTGNDDDNDVRFGQLQSFDRRTGVSFPLVPMNHRRNPLTQSFGRAFGQYGSYKQHQAWQSAVLADKRRHALAFGHLMTPNFGYAIGNFWNSYASIPDQSSD